MITIGADPELFLCNPQGKLISAVGIIGGDKHNPLPIAETGCAIQEDNVAAEFNIPPSQSLQDFKRHIKFTLDYLDVKAKGFGLSLAKQVASASFPVDQLQTWQSQVFGCEPDINAWTGQDNPKPFAEDPNLRSCGGHIHVGCEVSNKRNLIQSMDLFLGVSSLELDTDGERRKLYGKAGAYRDKPYGVEYRTLSNFWIWSDELIEWAWEGTQRAIAFVKEGQVIPRKLGNHIQAAINEEI